MGLRSPKRKKDYLLFNVFGPVLWPTSLLFSLFCRYQGLFSREQSGSSWSLPFSSIWRQSSEYVDSQFHYHICLHGVNSKNTSILYIVSSSVHYIAIAKNMFFVQHQCYRGADKCLARPDWKKNNWKVAIFRPTRRSLLPRRPSWTDNLLNVWWVACKSQSLVVVACFLPGRAMDLSAPQYKCLLVFSARI